MDTNTGTTTATSETTVMETKKKRIFVPDSVFIPAWKAAVESGGGAKECAKNIGLTVNSVLARASKMRSAGVRLPNLPRGNRVNASSRAKALKILAGLNGTTVEFEKSEGDKLIAKAAERKANKETEVASK